jgi:two-component system sensor kinase FixL
MRTVGEQLRLPEMLGYAVESATEPICITDLEDRFVFVNPSFRRAYGYSESELLGKTPDILFSPRNPPSLMAEILARTRRGGWRGEVLDRRKDGSEFPVFLSTSPVKDQSGMLVGLRGMAQDISSHRQAESDYRRLFETATEGVFRSTPGGELLFANPALARMFGYRDAEEMISAVTDLGREFYVVPAMRTELKRRLETHACVEGFETESYRKDGTRIWVSLNGRAVRNERGEVVHYEGTIQDITRRKQLEREVSEVGAEERRHLGRELHDGLGQFLAGIAFRAKALEQALASEGMSHAKDAEELAALMGKAIQQTRNLARGMAPFETEARCLTASLRKLAAETIQLFGIDCRAACPDSNLCADAQASLQLFRIAQEAIHNAIRHGQARQVEIELAERPDCLCLRIQDDGIGFHVEAGNPMGMGLQIMEHRAHSIGASLKVTSQPGRGAEIRCVLPRAVSRLPSSQADRGESNI